MGESSSKIDSATVRYVANLSRIDLSDEELGLFSHQLAEIVDYINQLDELDTDGVEPLAQAIEIPNVLREDEVTPSLSPQEALANAPERKGDSYKVPAVLD